MYGSAATIALTALPALSQPSFQEQLGFPTRRPLCRCAATSRLVSSSRPTWGPGAPARWAKWSRLVPRGTWPATRVSASLQKASCACPCESSPRFLTLSMWVIPWLPRPVLHSSTATHVDRAHRHCSPPTLRRMRISASRVAWRLDLDTKPSAPRTSRN